MTAADTDRFLVLIGAAFEDVQYPVKVRQQYVRSLFELYRETGIQNIR